MSRFNHNIKLSASGIIYRFLTIAAALALLLLLLPYGHQSLYDYSKDKPWNGNTIIASEGFPLLKPDSIYQQEKERALENYKPVYEKDPNVGSQQTAAFIRQYNTTLTAIIPAAYRDYANRRLREVYNAGIMNVTDYDRESKEGRKTVTISVQNTGTTEELNKVFTPKTAYEYIVSQADTLRYRRAILQRMNLSAYLQANLTYDKFRSESQRDMLEKSVSRFSGTIQSGQEIVHRGQIVDEKTDLVLRSMETYHNKKEESKAEIYTQRLGQAIFMCIIVCSLFFYFRLFRADYLGNLRTMLFTIMMVFVFPALTYCLRRLNIEVYAIPYCMLPIFLRVFTDSRTAFITHVAAILLSAIAVTHQFEFIFMETVAGLVAIYSMKHMSSRSELFQTVIYVSLASLACWLCFDLINKSFFSTSGIDPDPYISIIANGILLMISYLLLIPFERLFRFTSNVTLVELSNTNNEILRRLSEEAPGTFQHSLQVANLASEVARKIGANTQLVRTAALYHDIGKLYNPAYFTENQSGMNPHDNISYIHSAQIIINHVNKGLEMAEAIKLPPILREFITAHHGTGKTRYFLTLQRNAHPNDTIDERPYTYPGPNPRTIEQAILMMSDAVEAASRSLVDYTEENVSMLVERIIDSQMEEGFFNHCPITFEDISEAKQVFKEKLKIIYHTRISYPELKQEVQEAEDAQTGSAS
ncbi:MAG: HDIG domain-containing protein [Bacteroidaceae bacterium]|nr:HDIG domain-containing protein [Bacteroidaceae bacterium]